MADISLCAILAVSVLYDMLSFTVNAAATFFKAGFEQKNLKVAFADVNVVGNRIIKGCPVAK